MAENEGASTANDSVNVPWHILPVIVVSQFAGTSLWFAPNAVIGEMDDMKDDRMLGIMTSGVQFGFIIGTLCIALSNVADVVPPSLLFCVASLLGAAVNLLLIVVPSTAGKVALRVATGVTLSGIYPGKR